MKASAWELTANPVIQSDRPGDHPIAVYKHKVDAARVRALDESRAALERKRAIESRLKQENAQGSIKEEPGSQESAPLPPVFDEVSQQWMSQPGGSSFIGSGNGNAFWYGGQVASFRPDASYLKSCGCLLGPCEHQQ